MLTGHILYIYERLTQISQGFYSDPPELLTHVRTERPDLEAQIEEEHAIL